MQRRIRRCLAPWALTLAVSVRGQPFIRSVLISAGGEHNCAVLEDSTTKCWGHNLDGHLGIGDLENRGDGPGEMGENLPTLDFGTGRTAVGMSAGAFHRCAILDNGLVKCWGKGSRGELGLMDNETRGDAYGEMGDNLPYVDLGTGRSAVALTSGDYHTCVILDNGRLKCWGGSDRGQLGYGDTMFRGDNPGEMGDNLPYVDLGTGRTVLAIDSGDHHTCCLLDNGCVKCFGDNLEGQLGQGDTQRRGVGPDQMGDNLPCVDLGGEKATQVAAGFYHSCAVLESGGLKCWGFGGYGGLGEGETIWHGSGPNQMGTYLPAIKLGTNLKPVSLSAGAYFTCAILNNSMTKCWGVDTFGQLGIGTTGHVGDDPNEMGDMLPPVDFGTNRTAVLISSGDLHTCAIMSDGGMKCWGYNPNGQLGSEDRRSRGADLSGLGNNWPDVNLGPPLPTTTPTTTGVLTASTTGMGTTLLTTTSVASQLLTTTTSDADANGMTTTLLATSTLDPDANGMTTTFGVPSVIVATSTALPAGTVILDRVAFAGDGELGFAVDRLPPATPVRISAVDTRKWAARAGLRVGDRLMTVNGVPLAVISTEQFMQTLQNVRPLYLKFQKDSTNFAPGLNSGEDPNTYYWPRRVTTTNELWPWWEDMLNTNDEVLLSAAPSRHRYRCTVAGPFLLALLFLH